MRETLGILQLVRQSRSELRVMVKALAEVLHALQTKPAADRNGQAPYDKPLPGDEGPH